MNFGRPRLAMPIPCARIFLWCSTITGSASIESSMSACALTHLVLVMGPRRSRGHAVVCQTPVHQEREEALLQMLVSRVRTTAGM